MSENSAGQESSISLKGRKLRPELSAAGKIIASGVLAVAGGKTISNHVYPQAVDQGPGVHFQTIDKMPSQDLPLVNIMYPTQDSRDILFNNLPPEKSATLAAELLSIATELKEYGIFNNVSEIVKNYDKIIERASFDKQIPKKILYGTILIESSGDKKAVSPDKKAVGIAQFRVDAAKEMGLRVNDSVDERELPEKAIPAMAGYIAKYRDLFGNNLGFGVATYHAGPGNMAEALRVYAIDRGFKDPGELEPQNYKAYFDLVKNNKLSVQEVFINKRVFDQVVSRWDDDSKRYAKKAAVAAEEFVKLSSIKSTTSVQSSR